MNKILIGIYREDPELVNTYRNLGREAKLVLGGSIFEVVDMDSDLADYDQSVFGIPPLIENEEGIPLIQCTDGKGANAAWFSFGLNGERLGPFHVFKKVNPYVAAYISPYGIIQVFITGNEMVTVTEHRLELIEGGVLYSRKNLWSGFLDEYVPDSLLMLEPAIKLAYSMYEIKDIKSIVSPTSFVLNLHPDNKTKKIDDDDSELLE